MKTHMYTYNIHMNYETVSNIIVASTDKMIVPTNGPVKKKLAIQKSYVYV